MPDIKFAKLEEIPEGLREHAKQDGTSFVVNVVPNSKLTEFRDTNIAISKERDTLKDQLAALKPLIGDDVTKFTSELTELRTTAQSVKDGKLKGSDAIEAEVLHRVKSQTEATTAKLTETERILAVERAARADADAKFKRLSVHQAITSAVLAGDSPVNPAALPDILTRAEGLYTVQPDGSLVPKRGENIVYSASDGATPMPPSEWLVGLVKEAAYLGKQSGGGGANGARGDQKQYGGMTEAAFLELPPDRRIEIHRAAQRRAT